MTEPPRSANDLWRRLSEAQDAALASTSNRGSQEGDRAAAPATLARRTRRVRPTAILLLGGVAAAAAVLLLVRHRAPPPVPPERADTLGAASRVVLTDARSDLPLQFSDGSSLTFRAGSAGGMQRLGDSGADVVLERGRLDAHVVHASSTLWFVHAGPFKVRVTGTRFTVSWAAQLGRFEVAVYQGSVVIDGGPLGAGVPLGAGHRLTVENRIVRTDLLAATVEPKAGEADTTAAVHDQIAPTEPGPANASPPDLVGEPSRDIAGVEPRGVSKGAPAIAVGRIAQQAYPGLHDGDWLPLARRGAYREARLTARRIGWSGLCNRLDARRLLMLGDVARYAGAPRDAERAFGSLVARYPAHRLAGDAQFSLGRLAFEAGRPEKASRWFRRYVDDWPKGPLVDQALGRLMESAVRAGDRSGARSAAETYLVRAPHGPHAPLAREVLGGPSDRPQ